jgi:DNA-binding NarL/FixJ family response regulator
MALRPQSASCKDFPDAKIVMVTSHGQEKMVMDALKAGAKGYVLKPFDGQKLNEAIQKACKRVVLKDKLRAEVPSHGARFKVSIGQTIVFLHHPHHNSDCSRDLIKQVREFLAHAGVSPSSYEAKKDA